MPDLTPEATDSLATAARWRDGSTEYVLVEAARAVCHELAALREALDPVPADLAERTKEALAEWDATGTDCCFREGAQA